MRACVRACMRVWVRASVRVCVVCYMDRKKEMMTRLVYRNSDRRFDAISQFTVCIYLRVVKPGWPDCLMRLTRTYMTIQYVVLENTTVKGAL